MNEYEISKQISKAMHKEHLLELQKYTFGELVEAISMHNVSLRCVGEDDLIAYPMKDVKYAKDRLGYAGGPGIVIIYRDEIISDQDLTSIQSYLDNLKCEQ